MKQLLTLTSLICVAGLAVAADAPQKAAPAAPAAPAASSKAKLMDPSKLVEKAPATFDAKFETTKGDFTIHVVREWAPNGADRFYNLVVNGYYDDCKFFRVISGFMVQFGINGDPGLNDVWREAKIKDDPVKVSNKKGFVSFATAGPNTRTTQVFVNFKDNANLDQMGFSAFGQVTAGMDVVNKLNAQYGEGAPRGMGPDQGRIQSEGNAYLDESFANLDAIKHAVIAK